MIVYEPEIGSHIDRACREACDQAFDLGVPVGFTFNGVKLVAQPGDHAGSLRENFEIECEAQSAAYRASPEYAADQARQEIDALRLQAGMDACVARLPRAIRLGELEIVRWCAEFVPLNDWNYTHCDRSGVWSKLTQAGYLPGDCVGHPFVQTDPHVAARWIIGQVLDGLMYQGGVIAPIMATFAEEYLRWEKTGVRPGRSQLGGKT